MTQRNSIVIIAVRMIYFPAYER